MKYRFFTIPVSDTVNAAHELNQFCAQHRICEVEKHFVAHGAASFWSFCVTWTDQETALTSGSVRQRNDKIDYKELLGDDEFTLYSRLRVLRKTIAEREGTPAYNVFTNAQLAAVVQQRITTKSALLEIEGIGKMRVEKYADELLACLKNFYASGHADEKNTDHT
ncbi:HRDC domain-containing protein [Nitrosomonas sp. Nm51]|uniref:HRDC domain-containing protein n=1 Tax=Nitrosomonas sp. Nm51 TaxID=133720 RepID=UPI0008CEDFBC|nr:HRDC domain-containing protein [Nitrosomonas sp. Nm51]SEQ78947.1 HRDC domain-containing protein [Nitrosomonas sp. Nm51]